MTIILSCFNLKPSTLNLPVRQAGSQLSTLNSPIFPIIVKKNNTPDMMNNHIYDCIVIGVGSMGASACYHLASRGQKVLGIEQFSILHKNGAHSGQTRIIRKAYFEHPDYIPLLQRAYENWKSLEAMTGEQVYYPCGLLYAAPAGDALIEDVKRSAALYNIPLQKLTMDELGKIYPQFQLPDNYEVRSNQRPVSWMWAMPLPGMPYWPRAAGRKFIQEKK